MKVPQARRKHVVALPEEHELSSGWVGLAKKHGNTALTVILLICAVVMFIRWRMRSAEIARLSVGNELVTARNLVKDLRQFRLPGQTPKELLAGVNSIQNGANASISNVLNSSDADTRLKAQALLLRGDLYWELANFPPLPGSSTQPSLQMTESSDALLQKASSSYQELINTGAYANQHEELDGAHLGLAAIAENRLDWAGAQKELEAVQNDPNALPVLVGLAKLQIAQMPTIQKKLFIAPPTGLGAVAVTPAGPPAPGAVTQPAKP